MKDVLVSTLVKFLSAIKERPKKAHRVAFESSLNYKTSVKIRDLLLLHGFIDTKLSDRRSVVLALNLKGLSFLGMLEEMIE